MEAKKESKINTKKYNFCIDTKENDTDKDTFKMFLFYGNSYFITSSEDNFYQIRRFYPEISRQIIGGAPIINFSNILKYLNLCYINPYCYSTLSGNFDNGRTSVIICNYEEFKYFKIHGIKFNYDCNDKNILSLKNSGYFKINPHCDGDFSIIIYPVNENKIFNIISTTVTTEECISFLDRFVSSIKKDYNGSIIEDGLHRNIISKYTSPITINGITGDVNMILGPSIFIDN